MSAPITIRNSFALGQKLPNFMNWKLDGNVTATTSGEHTLATDPPFFAIQSATNWIQVGQQVLTQTPQNSEIDKEGLAFHEHPAGHGNEGDIVRTAGIYLIHPICQALWANPTLQGKVMCQSEASSNGIRADITFYRTPPVPQGTSRAVAVVELKKRGVINAPAKQNSRETKVMLEDAMKKITATQDHRYWAQRAQGQTGDTFFHGNSEILMKQASSYAIHHGTQFVALFNWDYLVLVHFTQMDPRVTKVETRRSNGVGEYCEMTIIPYKNSDHMRSALLGFLALAYQDTP
ncbi:hypothetical protein J7T55_015349 [Diaporthe amygdali]|uniref:uncharacterized protein n=1 Tax=Phomopsis amygdali TaxID=1214568 RepID=UPI0022FEEA7D|nr:uncharacterized protein J7T55_015349 [Diaporthe amygdali]KAJ0120619.1 hypothetical protein J7T55_015349 [Diaporthe amygdali]